MISAPNLVSNKCYCMNDLINNYFCSLENIFRNDITEMKENLQTVMNIVKAQADAISRQTVVIKKNWKKIVSGNKRFRYFPNKNNGRTGKCRYENKGHRRRRIGNTYINWKHEHFSNFFLYVDMLCKKHHWKDTHFKMH